MYVPMRSFPVSCIKNTPAKRSRSRCPTHVLRERSLSYRVHLSQHGPVGEELWLPGVHDDQVEERAPGLGLKRNQNKRLTPSSSETGGRRNASHPVAFQQVSHDGLQAGAKKPQLAWEVSGEPKG